MSLHDVLTDPAVEYYLFAALGLFPLARISERGGFSPLWALLVLVPEIGFALWLAALALRRWPERSGA